MPSSVRFKGSCSLKSCGKSSVHPFPKPSFGEKKEYLILETVINEMTLKVPVDMAEGVGVRPPVSADELEDLVAVLAKPDPRVPSNWSRRFKNHQEKLKSGDVYQVADTYATALWALGKRIYLPVLVTFSHQKLWFESLLSPSCRNKPLTIAGLQAQQLHQDLI